MSANTLSLQPRLSHGWRMGLANMLAKENFAWWRTRRWWIQILIAVAILNGSMALNMKGWPRAGVEQSAINFLTTAALFVPIIAAILAQDAVLDERHRGTAAWVLSKPLRRPSYILSKLIAYGLGFFVTWILIPFVIFYFQMIHAHLSGLSKIGFVGMIGLAFLNLFFYLTLSLMLATLFNSRLPGLGITIFVAWSGPLGILAQVIQKYVPWLNDILPWNLIALLGRNPPLGACLAMGKPLPTIVPIIATAVWCLLFVGVAIWRTGREEF